MTPEEKLNYMRIAAGIVGYSFDRKGLDMLVSVYDLVIEKQGDADLRSIVKVECEVVERETKRKEEEALKAKTNN